MASGRAHKLSALDVKRASKPGKYGDGNCLYLVVTESGAKHWLFRLFIRGKRRGMGLGSADRSSAYLLLKLLNTLPHIVGIVPLYPSQPDGRFHYPYVLYKRWQMCLGTSLSPYRFQ